MKGIAKFLLALIVIGTTASGAVYGFIQNTKYKNLQKTNSELQTENDALKKANSYLKDQIYELETEHNKKVSEAEEEKAKEVAKKEEEKKADNSNKVPTNGVYVPSLIGYS